MMESQRTQKWLMISFFVSVSLVFVYFIFTLIHGGPPTALTTPALKPRATRSRLVSPGFPGQLDPGPDGHR